MINCYRILSMSHYLHYSDSLKLWHHFNNCHDDHEYVYSTVHLN
jgi:hypothetical protein